VGGFELRIIDLKTKEEISLPRAGSDEEPSWAPDSRHVVYSSERGRKRDLFVMDVYDRVPTQITHWKGNFSSPAWAP
jgi:TolB protein